MTTIVESVALHSFCLNRGMRKNKVVNDVLDWLEFGIDFINYGNPMQELRIAIGIPEMLINVGCHKDC